MEISEQLKREAYKKGLALKNTGLDEAIICIRLEKQGIPYELAKEVAKNIFLQRQIDAINNRQPPSFFANKLPLILSLIIEIKIWFKMRKNNSK